jgi:hypothetical protein
VFDREKVEKLLASAKDHPTPAVTKSIEREIAKLDLYKKITQPAFLAGVGLDARPHMLAIKTWMYSRKHGAGAAVEALLAFVRIETVTTVEWISLDNVTTDHRIDLASGVMLLPPHIVPNLEFEEAVKRAHAPIDQRQGATLRIEKSFYPFVKISNPKSPTGLEGMDLRAGVVEADNALKAIALTGPANPTIRVATTEIHAVGLQLLDLQGTGHGFNYPIYVSPNQFVQVSDEAPAYMAKLQAMDQEDRGRIDVGIMRLATSLMKTPSDAIIDQAIALEAVLSDKNNKEELTYRLRIRAAQFLETQLEKKHEVKAFVTKLYAERSGVVHGGIPKKENYELRKEGEVFVMRLLKALVDFGSIPQWKDVELNGGLVSAIPEPH